VQQNQGALGLVCLPYCASGDIIWHWYCPGSGQLMSLKRHPALQPFSREHLTGLFHAHQLMWLSNGRARADLLTTVGNFKRAWEDEIALHFAEEERLFADLPVRPESLARLHSEHTTIRALALEVFACKADDQDLCLRFGQLLNDHIRWEERQFYPEIEQALSEEALQKLGDETRHIDERHKICKKD
jgi:hemerythrin-like domain-containing protein